MISIKQKEKCNGCSACFNICPKRAITMQSDMEGFLYPYVDKEKCINCDLCIKVCPIEKDNKNIVNNIEAIACKNKKENIRKESSSGGVFTALCEEVISKNGVVFGAAYDDKLNVHHCYVETIEDCSKFRGSKYVQSKIGETFKEVKEFLLQDKMVLFSGTPCQIAGLYSYLGREYDNLILVDIACHGVPSPLVFKKYLESLENKNGSKVNNISFRDKKTGWKRYSFKVSYNDKTTSEIAYDNIYMKGFLSDIYLRPSCYECKFKKPITYADLTLADYWGIDNIHPEFDDDKGTSLVLINTFKGKKCINNILNKLDYINTEYEQAIKYNPSIVNASNFKDINKRKKFFDKLASKNVEKLIDKYTKHTLIKKVTYKLKRIILSR